ncbi:MAG: IclR family transcriptional regulator [Planctomycetota bacterium]|jgi:DNA-binding IclR family transcriptional regulator
MPSTPALDRGLTILEYLAVQTAPVPFTRMLEDLSLPRASFARILRTLTDRGYIALERESRGYRLGGMVTTLASQSERPDELRHAAAPLLEELKEESGNTVALFGFDGRYTEVLDKSMHPDSVVMQYVGQRGRLAPGPWGHIFLHALEGPKRDEEERRLRTVKCFRSINRSNQEHYPLHGFTVEQGVVLKGCTRMAAPVRDREGKVIAALGLAGTEYSLPATRIHRTGVLLVRYAHRLSKALTS